MMTTHSPLLIVDDLHVTFQTERGRLQAVCGVSFDIQPGEIFGLVGETGCGKSLTGLSLLRMVPRPGRITSGRITFKDKDLLSKSEAEMQHIRGADIAMIFQDPTTSLNPVFQVGVQISRVLIQHRGQTRKDAYQEVLRMLTAVGLPDVKRIYHSYPHELSGGMQQRVMIAMALVCQPSLIIADEPTTALDVTIQAQILRLLRELRDQMGIAILLITHNLGVVASMCDRVAVLYAGRVVERGPSAAIFEQPQHPYTQGLIAAIPEPEKRGKPLIAIPGTVPPNPGAVVGCAFASRCPVAYEPCWFEQPGLFDVTTRHTAACLLIRDRLRQDNRP